MKLFHLGIVHFNIFIVKFEVRKISRENMILYKRKEVITSRHTLRGFSLE